MDSNSPKTTNESCISTTGTPASQRYSDNIDNVKYINPNFVDNSESSCQTREAAMDYQKYPNSSQDPVKPNKAAPNKILPTTLPLNGLDKRTNKSEHQLDALQEKSLIEMGYRANEVEGWENIVQPPKEDLYKLLKNMIDNHIKPSVQIRIGDVTFNCHLMVLQCYSDFFMECNNEILIKLPEEKITPAAFMMVYDWMLSTEPLVQREGILELFNAANFLRIKELINQCWLCLDDDVRFREDTAFLLYLEARRYGLENLEQLMLMRICKFFLTLVASKEFVELNAREICTLLSSNTIGVNSEIEIFMSVIRWLSHDWQERQSHMLDLVKCVRFSLMPPWFLVTLNKCTDCPEIDRVIEHSEVKKMINDGITYTTTQLYYGENREEFLHFLERYKLTAPMQRQWVYDKECNYHHRLECPNMQYVTYKSFLEYLEMIRTIGKNYWRSLEMDKGIEKPMHCCFSTDFRKSTEQNLISAAAKGSRDQGVQCAYVAKSSRSCRRKEVRKTKLIHITGSNKNSIRRTPRGCPRFLSASQTIYSTNNDDVSTEAEVPIDFKYPPALDVNVDIQVEELQIENNEDNEEGDGDEKREQQMIVPFCDDEHYQADVEQQLQQQQIQRHINNTTFSNLNTVANVIEIDTVATKCEQQTQEQQQQLLVQQQLQSHKSQTDEKPCTFIYKRPDDYIADDSDDYVIRLQQQRRLQQSQQYQQPQQYQEPQQYQQPQQYQEPQQYQQLQQLQQHQQQQQYIIVDTENDKPVKSSNTCTLFKENIIDCKSNNIPVESGAKQQKNCTLDEARISNNKILVFGGIDPLSYHSPHVQKYHQQQQHQEQQRKLQQKQQQLQRQRQHYYHQQLSLQRKRVFSIDGNVMNTTAHPYSAEHKHSHTANKIFENFGDHVLFYDIDAMEWRLLSNIPFGSRHHHAVVVCNGLIYVIGGTRTEFGYSKKSIFDKSVWCFNPVLLKWSLETNLPESRRDFAVIAIDEKILADNKELKHDVGFYVIGGEGVNGRALNSVWFYKVKRKMWIKKPSLNLGRYGLAAVMINDEIWVAGGIINHNSSDGNSESFKTKTAHKITDTMEILNLNRTHETLAKQHKDEYLYGLYRVDAGGGEGLDVGHGRLVNEPTQYGGDKIGDVNSGNDCCNIGQWYISRLHLRIPRLFGKFCKMPNNELYLLGGIGFKGHDPQHKFTSLSDIDVYNMKQHKWEHIGDLNLPRHSHDVGRLNDHCIVIVGGMSTHEQCLNNVEVFCTTLRKSLNNLSDLPWPVSGCAVVIIE